MISHHDRARQRHQAHATRQAATLRKEAARRKDGGGQLRAKLQAWRSTGKAAA